MTRRMQCETKINAETDNCLEEEDTYWKVFPRQKLAFECVTATRKNTQRKQRLHVFAFEYGSLCSGSRKFLVTSLSRFWKFYWDLRSTERHYYEVIPEGAKSRLYFDLEFSFVHNPDKQGPAMYVCKHLLEAYGLHCDRTLVLDLDATTVKKFSRHLIFHLPCQAVFKDNIHTGNFIRRICDALRLEISFYENTLLLSPKCTRHSVRCTCSVKCDASTVCVSRFPMAKENRVEHESPPQEPMLHSTPKYSSSSTCIQPGHEGISSKPTTENTCSCKKNCVCNQKNFSSKHHRSLVRNSASMSTCLQQKDADDDIASMSTSGAPVDHDCLCKARETAVLIPMVNSSFNQSEDLFSPQQVNSTVRDMKTVTGTPTNKTSLEQHQCTRVNTSEITTPVRDSTGDESRKTLFEHDRACDNGPCEKVNTENLCTQCELVPLQNGNEQGDICQGCLQQLLVMDKNGKRVLFCDEGVYTRNRNFRLYLSSKLKQNNPLVLSPDNQFAAGDVRQGKGKQQMEELTFLQSLVTNVECTAETRILNCDREQSQKRYGNEAYPAQARDAVEGYEHSPFTEVDCFVEKLIARNGRRGHVRRWVYFARTELLSYDIAGNRYCENIKRQHRSNNVRIVVDLKNGVYYQKCYDPECQRQNFKSREWSLPIEVIPMFLLEQDSGFSMDKFGHLKVTDLERDGPTVGDQNSEPEHPGLKDQDESLNNKPSDLRNTVIVPDNHAADLKNTVIVHKNHSTDLKNTCVVPDNQDVVVKGADLLQTIERMKLVSD
ncbi:PREDICTED: DNA-directed primase/polymerase protein-like isoform X2 [Priapulus caudatus]|uniref:DNA-directed primase/polymerase protein n=1 Tax=Priapulus caudatus TaxID=37621 RepID=A0ABM1EDI0_PRICU|nr:PREDICTED: DNA-directed primase/polymerase protein-like isoform X2 [Priapulus caudatus]